MADPLSEARDHLRAVQNLVEVDADGSSESARVFLAAGPASCADWLAERMLAWAGSQYPREVPADCTHASLVGWLLADALLTPEQSRQVKQALEGVSCCTICGAALAHRGKECACPQCDPEVVQGWSEQQDEDIDF